MARTPLQPAANEVYRLPPPLFFMLRQSFSCTGLFVTLNPPAAIMPIADPATQGLGNVMWVVDFNRQSLDRVVPGIRIQQWSQQFRAAGWHVVEVKYGPRLREAYAQPDGKRLEAWIDEMPNERYQSLFGMEPGALRERFLLDGVVGQVESLAPDPTGGQLATIAPA